MFETVNHGGMLRDFGGCAKLCLESVEFFCVKYFYDIIYVAVI